MSVSVPGERCIRAVYDAETVRVYQAYSDAIADAALQFGTFRSPPFSMTRMTWIKPSFLWMMYRSGWGTKDAGQRRILAIDIRRKGFEWALAEARSTSPQADSAVASVLVQWDPERDLHLNRLPYRSLQLGLRGEAVRRYVNDWIVRLTEVTGIAAQIHTRITAGDSESAAALLPKERVYPLAPALSERIAASPDCYARE